jgi:DNA ligase-1
MCEVDRPTRLRELAITTEEVRRTSSRKAKTELLAELLRRCRPEEIVPAVGFLLAKPRQGAIGVGWATVARLDQLDDEAETASEHPPTVTGFDAVLSEVMLTTGSGSVQSRSDLLSQFLTGCEPTEVEFVKRVLIGEARQGALAGVITDAAAKAAGVKAAAMRRGAMLQGDLAEAAYIALVEGPNALAAIDLKVQRPIQPMLASTWPRHWRRAGDLKAARVRSSGSSTGPASKCI